MTEFTNKRYTPEMFDAIALAQSPRGQYILSQALTVAIETLSAVPLPHREVSNIQDMTLIRDALFPMYAEIHSAMAEHVASGEAKDIRRRILADLEAKQDEAFRKGGKCDEFHRLQDQIDEIHEQLDVEEGGDDN